jgi:hypothetical protein
VAGSLTPCAPRRSWSSDRSGRIPGNLPPCVGLSGIDCMEEETMGGLIYLVGLIVVIMAVLSFFGLR